MLEITIQFYQPVFASFPLLCFFLPQAVGTVTGLWEHSSAEGCEQKDGIVCCEGQKAHRASHTW